jgi:hypothetical protein
MLLLHVVNTSYILVEAGVFIVESIWYKSVFKLSLMEALKLSFFANSSSILAGRIVWSLLN